MATVVVMPKYGLTMKLGKVVKWLVSEGARVEAGQEIAEIETEKVSNLFEAPTTGTLLRILVGVDEEAAVGGTIAIIGEPGEDIGGLLAPVTSEPAPVGAVADAGASGGATLQKGTAARALISPAARKLANEFGIAVEGVVGSGPGGRITRDDVVAAASPASAPTGVAPATPAAKKLAAELGVDLTGIVGSGPSGRVRLEDVAASAASQESEVALPASADPRGAAKERPYSGVRRIIGERMGESLRIAVPVTYNGLADVQELTQLLAQVREQMRRVGADVGEDVMTTAAVVRAAAMTLERMPRFNSSLVGDVIYVWKNINVGVAVALSRGLVVPVVREANRKSLSQIAGEIRELAERAQENQLTSEEVNGATFTVTTLGPYRSIDFFTPIINPPESAILGIGRTRDTVVALDGMPVVRSSMGLSLTCDHRVLDGAPSAEFLETVMDILAEPLGLLV